MIPLWMEIVAASLSTAFALYKTIRKTIDRQRAAEDRWRVYCHAADKGTWFYAVNGRWNHHFDEYRRAGGCQKVRGPIDPTDDNAMADGRVEAECRVATLNAQRANYR